MSVETAVAEGAVVAAEGAVVASEGAVVERGLFEAHVVPSC